MNEVLKDVYNVCNSVKHNYKGPITFRKLISVTRKAFNAHGFNFLIHTEKTKKISNNNFYIDAYYYEQPEELPPIEIEIKHRFDSSQLFFKQQVIEFLIQIYDAVVHELCHQSQHRARNFKHTSVLRNTFKSYLSDPDEVDAYSLSIAIELLRTMTVYRAKLYMRRVTSLSELTYNSSLVTPSLNLYTINFSKTKLLKQLSKKVYKKIEVIDPALIFK